jgi:hypothetical protein
MTRSKKKNWACNMNGGKRKVYMMLVGKPEGKRPEGRPRHRLKKS